MKAITVLSDEISAHSAELLLVLLPNVGFGKGVPTKPFDPTSSLLPLFSFPLLGVVVVGNPYFYPHFTSPLSFLDVKVAAVAYLGCSCFHQMLV